MLVREKMVGIDGGGDERESGEFRERKRWRWWWRR